MLHVRNIDTFHGTSQALFDVSLTVGDGEVVTLLGRNGMGKSTTITSIIGLTPPRRGAIFFAGRAIEKAACHTIARMGIGLVPEGRRIFPTLTVHENLVATAANPRRVERPYTLDAIFALFPRLAERRRHFGNQLSGGEQQMLAIGRALMINPRLLLLDEATEGLAPLVRREIWRALAVLKDQGLAILVIDKNLDALMELARRHYIMEKGRIVWSGTTADLRPDRDLQARYIGV